MMQIRPIAADELERFASVGASAQHAADVLRYVEELLAVGATRLDWCLLAWDDRRLLGGVALWTVPSVSASVMGIPSDLVLLEAPWDQPELTIGVHLLEDALARMRALGARIAGHVLDTPAQAPQWQFALARRIALLERSGFALARETRRFEWRNVHEVAGLTLGRTFERLTFRTFEEVGADAFVAAIARVTTGTLDRRLREQQERLGPAGAARALLDLVQALGYEPGWWQLAYTATDELVGLIMPAKGVDTAFIGYIGVTPEQRGHGYGGELLARATALLQTSGVTRIVADTDTGNAPMADAFRRVGYTQ